ncbi:hypothetical protein [Fodinibius halophilus]|uniref:YcxB family protein n=1 Tax=Fodinibius halophilus TaxID=1736908 RepID=A0A6M1TAR3_9BACT|nr:hypothetical protein [Fodinibius halophilus]NGP89513.1 hypothetical protein [Fodinibius halophilus]
MMEPFELTVDTETIYVKIIRFLGTFLMGFFIGSIIMKYQYDNSVDWMNVLIGVGGSATFAFFPGLGRKPKLQISPEGIFLKNYSNYSSPLFGKKKYTWDTITAVNLKKNKIQLTNSIGSTEKIKLPLHTKEQVDNLRNYLKKITQNKDIVYQE